MNKHLPINLPKATVQERTTRLSHPRPLYPLIPLIPWPLAPWDLASETSCLLPVDKDELLVNVAGGGFPGPTSPCVWEMSRNPGIWKRAPFRNGEPLCKVRAHRELIVS